MQGLVYSDSVIRPCGIGCCPFYMLGGVIVGVYLILFLLLSLCILHEYLCFIEFFKRRKDIKCEACLAFFRFIATSLINSIIQEHEC